MIEDPPLLVVRRNFERPRAEDIAAFAGLQTGYVVDAMGGGGALDGRIKPIVGVKPFCGVAITCDAGAGDNLATFGALNVAKPGDVIVSASDGHQKHAVIGDLMLGMMRNKGIAAFVTDGLVRDVVGLRAVGLPCYAAGLTPNSPARNGPGSVGLPIVVGGVAVSSGDIILGDEDGVVVVPRALIAATMAKLPAVKAAEAALEAKVKAGLVIPDFIQSVIDAGRFREID